MNPRFAPVIVAWIVFGTGIYVLPDAVTPSLCSLALHGFLTFCGPAFDPRATQFIVKRFQAIAPFGVVI